MDSFVQSDRPKVQERELAKFNAKQMDTKKAENVGMLNPMRDNNEGTYRGGEGNRPVTTSGPGGR